MEQVEVEGLRIAYQRTGVGPPRRIRAPVVDERVQLSLRLANLPPEQFATAMMPSMFSPSAPAEAVARFAASVRASNPAGFWP